MVWLDLSFRSAGQTEKRHNDDLEWRMGHGCESTINVLSTNRIFCSLKLGSR